jgi:uncharacterized protein YgiB involved in biofilm formation
MKRSKKLALTGLMAVGGVSLTACDQPANVAIHHKTQDAYAYTSLEECKAKGEVPAEVCEKAEKQAEADDAKAARYDNQSTCEDVYGEGQCVPRYAANGHGSFWGPLIAGFVVGRMMDGGWGGRGYYHGWRGGYYTLTGAPIVRDYATGRTRISSRGFDAPDVAHGPPKVLSRGGAISRGGFGGRMSARSYGGGFGHGFGG